MSPDEDEKPIGLREWEFKTKEEADAFYEGIAFVNDSALDVDEPVKLQSGMWQVLVVDNDAGEE